MLNETFYLDGIDARSAGIQLQAPIEFSEAVPVVEAQTIPGRNGDLIWETGSYENRSGSASCFCLQKDVEKAISSAGRFLMGKKGYRRLETSDDPNHYWMARVENSPQIAMRLRTLAPFEIGFDCKPQRFVKEGENPIVFTQSGILFNMYGQEALPFITVYGHGAGQLVIGDCLIDIKSLDGVLYLDSDTQNAYNNRGNQNNNINAPVFPFLPTFDGGIGILWDGGIERVEIVPRWWEL
jgi:phage-related protein